MKWRSLDERTDAIDARPLREILRERKQKIGQYVPAAILEVHAQVVAELKAKGLAANSRPLGAKAPSSHSPIIMASLSLQRTS
jgi:hypothetical protein